MTPMSRIRDNIEINPAALRHIRRLTGLRVTTLAAEINVAPCYVSHLEAGRRTAVNPEVFAALCDALRVTDRRALMAWPVSQAA